ncbi:hypothetical protein F0562_005507 [Nyssa sinensis]|uniref:ARM repeat N-terminal plant domain-containing protein n=1 Tax=Nyssa sinensis TaxID=561372 RepID=A0A5J5AL16_9ASTE|nr:hypothetical protein F0562_005507 [Nyssa sinensis]
MNFFFLTTVGSAASEFNSFSSLLLLSHSSVQIDSSEFHEELPPYFEGNPSKRRASILKFFRELPSQDDDGQVLPISGLWNTAMAHPNDPEFIELGIFECMAALIWKGLKNHQLAVS